MTDNTFPHHRLVAYQLAIELVRLIASTPISDAQLRQQARKSANSCALNTAEGAARYSRADKSRVFAIARAEACEAVAAVEIAVASGSCKPEYLPPVLTLGRRVSDVLSRLVQ
jgi:four helix bundle protein